MHLELLKTALSALECSSESGFFPRLMCQTPQNTYRRLIFSFPRPLHNCIAFSG